MNLKSILLACVCFCTSVQASVDDKTQVSFDRDITIAKTGKFHSKLLNEDIPFNLYLPKHFHFQSKQHTYPVIFINGAHGNQFFHAVTGLVEFYSRFERMPESIVISLNYSGHYPEINTNGMWTSREVIDRYGKPELFNQFMKQELLPYLTQQYRANDKRMIIGVSGSSIYPLYSLLNDSELFSDYVFLASSDMIGMGFDKNVDIIEQLASLPQKNNIKRKSLIYLADADDDLEKDQLSAKNHQRIKQYKADLAKAGFQLEVASIENERHYDALLKTLMNVFELQYPESLWAPKYRHLEAQPGNTLANIDAFYQTLSEQVGFTVLPRGDRWNSVNNLRHTSVRLERAGKLDQALQVANRWQQDWPYSAEAKLATAKLMKKFNQQDKAMLVLNKAIELATEQQVANLDAYIDLQKTWQSQSE